MNEPCEVAVMDDNRKPSVRIDIDSAQTLKAIELGQEVEICIKGKVKMLRGFEEGYREVYKKGEPTGKKEPYKYNGCIEVEVGVIEIEEPGAFMDPEDDE